MGWRRIRPGVRSPTAPLWPLELFQVPLLEPLAAVHPGGAARPRGPFRPGGLDFGKSGLYCPAESNQGCEKVMTRSVPPTSIAASPRRRQAGLTLVEAVFSLAILSMLIAGAGTAMTGLQGAFNEGQSRSQMIHRGQRAMERMVSLVSQAVTVDPEFAGFDSSGVNQFRGLRFRMLDSVVTGSLVYDDVAVVFVYGPTASSPRCDGVIIGRGTSITSVSNAGAGPDGILGTTDDDTRASVAAGFPAVELLVPSTFSPSTGSMLTFEVDTVRRGVTITLRLNVRDGDGQFIFANDSVIQERVSLRR